MSRSPIFPWWAAAPLRQHTREPRAPGITYVSKRAPFSTSAQRIFSWGKRLTASIKSASTVSEPT